MRYQPFLVPASALSCPPGVPGELEQLSHEGDQGLSRSSQRVEDVGDQLRGLLRLRDEEEQQQGDAGESEDLLQVHGVHPVRVRTRLAPFVTVVQHDSAPWEICTAA